MDIKYGLAFGANLLLFITSLYYGMRFIRQNNHLLGWEWWIMSLSTGCIVIFSLTNSNIAYEVSMFCDKFTRAAGIPVITIAGLMVVTHRLKPSLLIDVALFCAGIALTIALISLESLSEIKPYYLLASWSMFSIFLAYFAYRLICVGESYQAAGVILALILNQITATVYDFFPIPEESEDRLLFYTWALTCWSYLVVQLYYAYSAMERVNKKTADSLKVLSPSSAC